MRVASIGFLKTLTLPGNGIRVIDYLLETTANPLAEYPHQPFTYDAQYAMSSFVKAVSSKQAPILGGIDAKSFELAFFCLPIKGEGSLVIVIYN
jgi:hypothetical protein